MFRRAFGRIVLLAMVALVAEHAARGLSQASWFTLVFVTVFFADNLGRLSGQSDRPLFLEDVFTGVALYASFGYFSSVLDAVLSVQTGRHASPALPAVVLALLDKSWPSENLPSKRR